MVAELLFVLLAEEGGGGGMVTGRKIKCGNRIGGFAVLDKTNAKFDAPKDAQPPCPKMFC